MTSAPARRPLFVQPHFDDVALSCGGLVAAWSRQGPAPRILTLFGGDYPQGAPLSAFATVLHRQWGLGDHPIVARRLEDEAAARLLDASVERLDELEAVYRGGLYRSPRELFGAVKPEDEPVGERLFAAIAAAWRGSEGPVFLPLGVGEHVDHQLTHAAGARLEELGAAVFYYEDHPYVLADGALERRLAVVGGLAPLTVEVAELLERRLEAMAAYASQLPLVFAGVGAWQEVTRARARSLSAAGGAAERVWARATSRARGGPLPTAPARPGA